MSAKLDDAEIWRLKTVEHLTYPQIMERMGCSRGGVHKAISRWLAQHPADGNGEAPGGVTAATPGMTDAVAQALNKAHESVESVGAEPSEPGAVSAADDTTDSGIAAPEAEPELVSHRLIPGHLAARPACRALGRRH